MEWLSFHYQIKTIVLKEMQLTLLCRSVKQYLEQPLRFSGSSSIFLLTTKKTS